MCARKLVSATNRDTVAREYFRFDGALRGALQKKWNLDDGAFAKTRVSDGVCKRL